MKFRVIATLILILILGILFLVMNKDQEQPTQQYQDNSQFNIKIQ